MTEDGWYDENPRTFGLSITFISMQATLSPDQGSGVNLAFECDQFLFI